MWKYSMPVGWVVMRARVEAEVSRGRFTLYLTAQKAIGLLSMYGNGRWSPLSNSVVN
jgi:hypothetical protein